MSRLMSAIGRLLVGRQVVLEGVLELLLPVRVGAERVAGHGLARGVELEQLLGHVAHGLLDAGLRALPRRAAEPIERRLAGAGVLLDEVEPLDRDEQLVVAGVAQLEELLLAVADADLLQADEDADAVVDVDDEVADLEIAQIRQERLGRRSAGVPARGALPRRRRPRRRSGGRRRAAGTRATACRARRAPRRTARRRRGRPARRGRRSPSAARSCARRGPASRRRTASCRPPRAACGSRRPSRRRGRGARRRGWQRDADARVGRRPDRARRRRVALGQLRGRPASQSAKSSAGAGGCSSPVQRLVVAVLQLLEQLRDAARRPRRARTR